jgi:developmentally-regulated GTP-binding protein 2
MGILDKIAEIEAEMARTQKNKATNYHLGMLRGRVAQLRAQLMAGPKAASSSDKGFGVEKTGDARICLIGFPSVGKSTFCSLVTDTESEAASYEFTTLTCIGGILDLHECKVQLVDTPGIIEGAAQGKGRGREVIAVCRTADLLLMIIDAAQAAKQRRRLCKELRTMGIRMNERRPDISFARKKSGGVQFTSTLPELTYLNERVVKGVLQMYKIFHAQVVVREDCTVDQFIDTVLGNAVYIPCVFVYNKVDSISLERVDRLARLPHSVVCSFHLDLNVDTLLEMAWQYLDLVRVYTKRRGEAPSFDEPIVLRGDAANVRALCRRVHRDFEQQLRFALIWGSSAKHNGQRVGLDHCFHDSDVVQLVKTGN